MNSNGRPSQGEFIAQLIADCFRDMNQLNVTERELYDALIDVSTHGLLRLTDNLSRAILISSCIRRVRELHLVDHPETIVKAAFADMLEIMRKARADRTAEELTIILHADEFGAGELARLQKETPLNDERHPPPAR